VVSADSSGTLITWDARTLERKLDVKPGRLGCAGCCGASGNVRATTRGAAFGPAVPCHSLAVRNDLVLAGFGNGVMVVFK
jgi:hypothetical protein